MATPRRFRIPAGLAAALCISTALAQQAPSLGSAASFAVLGATSVTNAGQTVVSGNVGVAPGTTIAGLPASAIRLGEKIANDDRAREAQRDAASAYDGLTASSCMHLPVLTDVPIPPGVYCVTTPFSGITTLAPGTDAKAPWIFQVTGALTLMPNATISVINGGENGNVYWRVPGSVTLATDSAMVGNILARGDIVLAHGASLLGRALSLTGKVTLDTNNVSLCCEPIALSSLSNGTAGTPYSSVITATGGMPPYTFEVIEGIAPTGNQCGHFEFAVMATDKFGCHGVRKYAVDIKSAIDFVPDTLPPATACVYYEQKFDGINGIAPYKFIGTPPAGLRLTSNGLLSGTPAAAGTYSFTVCITDSAGCTFTRTYTLLVNPNVLTIAPSTVLPGIVGVPYLQTFTPSGCPGPFTCTINPLPLGFTFLNCTLLGTSTTATTYDFAVSATDPSGSAGTNSYRLQFNCAPITVTTTLLPDGVTGTFYTTQLQATSIVGPAYTFAIAPGSSVPPGFAPLAADGTLSGTPTTPGPFNFFVIATDRYGCSSNPQEVEINILTVPIGPNCQPLTLSPSTVPDGILGVAYPPTQITATGGTGPYTFTVSSGTLPPGLGLPGGLLSGIPTATGAYCATILGMDPQGCIGTITYSIIINPAPCPVISLSPTILPPAVVNDPYMVMLTAAGGTAPYTFTVFSGALPAGLTLNPVTGLISGIPITAGVSNITFIATDANGCIGSLGCSIVLVTYVPAMSMLELLTLLSTLACIAMTALRSNR
jgi:hypothetical protein